MFYAQFILAKKGPLSKIWLAAHWEKKLTKAQIFETDVSQAIEEVITPKVKMALRTVGHLLLGIVRIYSKKTRYLLADTNEAFLKMRLNFRNGIQLEIENLLGEEENNENIDVYDEINMTIPEFMDVDLDEGALQANLSRFEDITLKDDYDLNAPINLKGVEYPKFGASGKGGDFGDFDDFYGSWPASSIHTPVPESFEHVRRSNDSQLFMEPGVESNTIIEAGSEIKEINETNIGKDFEFDNNSILTGMEGVRNAISANGDDLFSSIIDIIPQETIAPGAEFEGNENMELGDETGVVQPENYDKNDNRGSFSLEPLNTTLLEGRSKKKAKRPRKLIVDDSTCVSADILKNQVEDFSDILATITMAPPSKKMLKMCMTGDLNHLMSEPGMSIGNKQLVRLYQSHLVPTAYKADIGFEQPEESSSSDRQSQPWDELELNDQIADDVSIELGVDRVDSRLDDFIDIDHPIDDPQIDRTMELIGRNDLSEIAPMNGEGFEDFGFNNGENKENDEVEEYNDPFSMSSNSSRGKLEAYGFGSAVKKAIYDDSKWAKRTKQILKKIGSSMENEREISFSSIVSTAKNRKQAAEQFYSLLSLAKSQAVTVEQKEPFGEILIRSGEKFRQHLDEAEKSDMADLSRIPLQII